MTKVSPLRLRIVNDEWCRETPAPPHDALSPALRQAHLNAHPLSYLGVTLAPEDSREGESKEELLLRARANFEHLIDEGVFSEELPEQFYAYRLETEDHSQTGLVAAVSTADYEAGHVRVHEQVKTSRTQHLADHSRIVKAQSSPIALAVQGHAAERLRKLLAEASASEPLVDFSDGLLRQRIWALQPADPNIGDDIGDLFADEALYLIDGHHRAAASSAYRQYMIANSKDGSLEHDVDMLCAIFPIKELRNRAFHRVLLDIEPHAFVQEISAHLKVSDAVTLDEVINRENTEVAIALSSDGKVIWHLVELPFDSQASNLLDNLDQVRLNRQLIEPILGLDEASANDKITHQPGFSDRDTLSDLVVPPNTATFVMRAVSNADLIEASDLGLVMPPKSTYFEPKVRSGVFVRQLHP